METALIVIALLAVFGAIFYKYRNRKPGGGSGSSRPTNKRK